MPISVQYLPYRALFKTNSVLKQGLLLLCLIFSLSKINAQDDVDYSVHANIIYHFTKYIDWPNWKKTGDFVIGVVGETPLYDELKSKIANKKAGTQNIVIKRYSSSATSFNCQILFISDAAAEHVKKIVEDTRGAPILLVSESRGLAQKGSCINFIIVNDKIRLEINKENIERRDLNIATELLALGVQVK